ncbi:DUF2848 domain-containing protein [Acuticoccus sp. I52.16.1]|uniref:DUF2848 domain-containing protein n=1 Tax=Acuticoccus sp. I52.16.1 TaxID=2928472 RepID=UPI001FD3FCF5|nr:DUF2848 domain-containing protein [Acuticoccus sp. I52.16.1]UOM33906.1 DUF2848 domain-containing protein [Acuticoccus sp. I52.16.1]
MNELPLRIESRDGVREIVVTVDALVIAGWTGRDPEAMEHHIQELEALGVKRPAATPMYYPVSVSRLTRAEMIEAIGNASSGEAEYVLFETPQGRFVGVGSDHTDREAETVGVTLSKQLCDKPVSLTVWPYEEVADHWDELEIESVVEIDGETVTYQSGKVSAMLAPETLIEKKPGGLPVGTVMFCGTLPAIGGVRPSQRFKAKLHDPILGRTLRHGYDVRNLDVPG